MSDRDYTNASWFILENALESETENKVEAMYLEEYKKIVALRNAEKKKLNEIKDNEQFNDDYTRISNQIKTYNEQLNRLEEKKPLKDIVERKREKELARWIKPRDEAVKSTERVAKQNHPKLQGLKKFLKDNILWLILALIAIVALILGVTLPNENWFRKLILSPFVLIGGLTIWLGCLAMAEQFEKYTKKDWQKILIFIISMFGTIVLSMWIK